MYPDQQVKTKMEAQKAYENQCATPQAAMGAVCGGTFDPSLSAEARRSEQFHYEQASKAGDAARFLSSHPEFDEFIRLVRSGALQF